VWLEIQTLLSGRTGKVLDLACGTGRTFDFLRENSGLDLHGCDISQFLIDRAVSRGCAPGKLRVTDATKTDYRDNEFDYCYSIGSLEHFTKQGIEGFMRETRRICNGLGFHQIPVSKSGFNEGWITPYQAYWNNSEQWWHAQFAAVFDHVRVMTSGWDDARSRGVWFVVSKTDFFWRPPSQQREQNRHQ
jgi:ubiquinone/menaquinone biosynthesis C-methylase UbiE